MINIINFAPLAHLTLTIFYLLFNKNIKKINTKNFYKYFSIVTLLYLIGHILIFKGFYNLSLKVNNNNINNNSDIYYRMCGHSVLLIFILMTFFMYNNNRNFKVVWNNIYGKYNIIFILGQIGMIYLYYNEYYKNKSTFINIINLITFSLLTIFYFSKVIGNYINKENNLIQLGLFLVGLLYFINIINLYYDINNIKNKDKLKDG